MTSRYIHQTNKQFEYALIPHHTLPQKPYHVILTHFCSTESKGNKQTRVSINVNDAYEIDGKQDQNKGKNKLLADILRSNSTHKVHSKFQRNFHDAQKNQTIMC